MLNHLKEEEEVLRLGLSPGKHDNDSDNNGGWDRVVGRGSAQ
jgi:hypothetical protein